MIFPGSFMDVWTLARVRQLSFAMGYQILSYPVDKQIPFNKLRKRAADFYLLPQTHPNWIQMHII